MYYILYGGNNNYLKKKVYGSMEFKVIGIKKNVSSN